MSAKAYWNIDELAEWSGLSKGTLYNWVSEQKIPFHKINGAVRFKITSMENFFNAREIKPKTKPAAVTTGHY